MGKEVLTSHSHRGFTPVMQTANRVEGTFNGFSQSAQGSIGSDEVQR